MPIPDYIIVTGYYGDKDDEYHQKLYPIWLKNTIFHTRKHPPKNIYVINSGGYMPEEQRGVAKWIDLDYNIGHVVDTMAGGVNAFKHGLCGWTMSTLMGALTAYSCNCDLIYKEQDCLAFGDWVPLLYSVLNNDIVMTTGRLSDDLPFRIEQSLFGMKRDFLIEFVRTYLAQKAPDWEVVPEHKWAAMVDKEFKGRFEYLPFGYGRNRPINYDDKIFYMQHDPHHRLISDEEFRELKIRELI